MRNPNMKRPLHILLVWLATMSAMAQEKQDPWVGTWTSESYSKIDWKASNATKDCEGTIQELIEADYKLVIRITKNGSEYNVRAKDIKVSDTSDASYHSQYTVKKVEGNAMWLESHKTKDPFYVNGKVETYSNITYYTKLTLNNGTLHYSYYKYHSVDYDRNMRYKGEDTQDMSNMPGSSLDLFNDDW